MKRASKIISIFLFGIMLFSITKNSVLHTIYQYNTELFVSLFCENKDRPMLNCDGKCYLAKMYKEQNKKDATNMLKQLTAEVTYYNFSSINYSLWDISLIKSNREKITFPNNFYSFLFTLHLVKPPESSFFFYRK